MQGIRTLKVSTNKMEYFEDQCRLLARVVGREKAWLKYKKWHDEVFRFLQARLEEIGAVKKPRVYYNTSAKGHYDTVNAAHFVAKMIQI